MVYLCRKRVVVTGMGTIAPLGNQLGEFWDGLINGHSGVGPITQFDTSHHACKIAAEVRGFSPSDYLNRKDAKRIDRFAQFAVGASQQAIAHADLTIDNTNASQVGVIIGTGFGGIPVVEAQTELRLRQGASRCSPFTIPTMIANMAAGLTAIYSGAKGLSSCTVTACAAGANAIGEAFRLIQNDYATAMICGGTEAAITPLAVSGFSAAKALALQNEAPARASCPFSQNRNGFVIGEGAGILILEELNHALQRGATVYAEIVGYGATCDAYHMTAPSPDGEGAARAMELALKDAALLPNQVDYINAHGTSTLANDVMETFAIKRALGTHAYQTAVSSTKSMTGHLLGGAGGIEAIATVMAIAHNQVPPTINLNESDPDCDLDYVPHKSREQPIGVALTNSFGFGGHNVTLAFRKFEG